MPGGAGPYRLILDFDRITTEQAAPLVAVFDEWAPWQPSVGMAQAK
jgi:hypothetical protein